MSKKKVGAAPAASFEAAWITAEAGRARSLVDEAGERGADLVDAWIAGKNAAAVAEIAADDDAPGPARKAARRGLNVLRSRGVLIPDRTRVGRVAAASAGSAVEAWFRPPDGGGTSAFTIGARAEEARYRLVDVIIKSGVGLVSVAPMQMSRTQLRETFDGIARQFGYAPAPVPIAWARARIAEARAENDASRSPVPLAFEGQRDLLGPAPVPPPPHPADEARLSVSDEADALSRSAKLHAEPEVRGWLPAPEATQRMLMEVGANVRVEEGDTPAAAEAKVRAILERATDLYFTPDARRIVAGHMKDAAVSILARGERERAAELLLAARAVLDRGAELPPHAAPFLRAFFEKAFGLAAARAAQKR